MGCDPFYVAPGEYCPGSRQLATSDETERGKCPECSKVLKLVRRNVSHGELAIPPHYTPSKGRSKNGS